MKGSDEGVGESTDGGKNFSGYDKEESVVREEGNDKDVDEENTVWD